MDVNDYCRFCSAAVRIAGQIHHSKHIFEKKGRDKTIFERLHDIGLTLTKRRDMSFRSCVKCDTKVNRLVSALPDFRRWEQAEKRSLPAAPVAAISVLVSSQTSHGATDEPATQAAKISNPAAPVAASSALASGQSVPGSGESIATWRAATPVYDSDPSLSAAPSPTPSSYDSSSSDKRSRCTPTKTPRSLKKMRPCPPSPAHHEAPPTARRSIIQVRLFFLVVYAHDIVDGPHAEKRWRVW